MSDFNQPILTTAYVQFLQFIKDRDVDAITLCLNNPSNTPIGAIKWERGTSKFQEWNGTTWVDMVISIASGGTGANNPSGIRLALGLGTMATQNNNAVNITGGTISGVPLNASDLATGTVPNARLGSGSTGAGALFLADDHVWKTGIPVGAGALWFTNVPPAGFLICDGSAVSRATYAALFAIWGGYYGAGDGVNTFNLPNLTGRFTLGGAVAGYAGGLGITGGAINHTHNVAAHTHTSPAHAHSTPAHAHTYSQILSHGHPAVVNDPGHTHAMKLQTDPGGRTRVLASSLNAVSPIIIDDAEDTIQSRTTGITVGIADAYGAIGSVGTTDGSAPNTNSASPGETSAAAPGTDANNPPFIVINYIVKY